VREHRFSIELPHSAPRLWALFERYDLWKEFAPSVLDVVIVHPGNDLGDGLLRKITYPLPLGHRGESYELVTNVEANVGYDYLVLRSGLSGSIRLTPIAPNRTRLDFHDRFHISRVWLRPLEGTIYRFINNKNEQSMQGASTWLDAHPDFHPELIEPAG